MPGRPSDSIKTFPEIEVQVRNVENLRVTDSQAGMALRSKTGEIPILKYLLKKSSSSNSDRDMMIREYCTGPIFSSTSFQIRS